MYFTANLLKHLKPKNKFKDLLTICENNDLKSLKKYLKHNNVNINDFIKVLNFSSEVFNYKLGYELLKYHYKKTLGLTQNPEFNEKYFSPIQGLYIKRYTNGIHRYEASISYTTGNITAYNETFTGKIG